MEDPKKFAQDFAAQRAQLFKEVSAEEDICMNGIGRVVCEMLASKPSITLDSLLDGCARKRDDLGLKEKPEQNEEWHRLNAMIAHLKNLKE